MPHIEGVITYKLDPEIQEVEVEKILSIFKLMLNAEGVYIGGLQIEILFMAYRKLLKRSLSSKVDGRASILESIENSAILFRCSSIEPFNSRVMIDGALKDDDPYSFLISVAFSMNYCFGMIIRRINGEFHCVVTDRHRIYNRQFRKYVFANADDLARAINALRVNNGPYKGIERILAAAKCVESRYLKPSGRRRYIANCAVKEPESTILEALRECKINLQPEYRYEQMAIIFKELICKMFPNAQLQSAEQKIDRELDIYNRNKLYRQKLRELNAKRRGQVTVNAMEALKIAFGADTGDKKSMRDAVKLLNRNSLLDTNGTLSMLHEIWAPVKILLDEADKIYDWFFISIMESEASLAQGSYASLVERFIDKIFIWGCGMPSLNMAGLECLEGMKTRLNETLPVFGKQLLKLHNEVLMHIASKIIDKLRNIEPDGRKILEFCERFVADNPYEYRGNITLLACYRKLYDLTKTEGEKAEFTRKIKHAQSNLHLYQHNYFYDNKKLDVKREWIKETIRKHDSLLSSGQTNLDSLITSYKAKILIDDYVGAYEDWRAALESGFDCAGFIFGNPKKIERALNDAGRHNDAMFYLTATSEQKPSVIRYNRCGEVEFCAGNFDNAIKCFTKAIEFIERNGQDDFVLIGGATVGTLLWRRAVAKQFAGDLTGAVGDLTAVIRKFDGSGANYCIINRAIVRYLNGSVIGAIRDFEAALKYQQDVDQYELYEYCLEDFMSVERGAGTSAEVLAKLEQNLVVFREIAKLAAAQPSVDSQKWERQYNQDRPVLGSGIIDM